MRGPLPHRHGGLPYALGTYTIWGLLPLYLRLIHDVPPFEFVAWRIIFTVPLCLMFLALLRQWGELRAVLRDPRSTAADQRRALFVLSRHDRENAELVKALAARTDYVGEHARNLVHQARENWR